MLEKGAYELQRHINSLFITSIFYLFLLSVNYLLWVFMIRYLLDIFVVLNNCNNYLVQRIVITTNIRHLS